MPDPVYLDHNATTPVRPEAVAATLRALETLGNPSSVHAFGRRAHGLLEDCRDTVAALAGAEQGGYLTLFTSGGTEANALALRGLRRPRLLVSAIEHPSALSARADAETVPVTAEGVISPDALRSMLAESDAPALVSLMLANNENRCHPTGRRGRRHRPASTAP